MLFGLPETYLPKQLVAPNMSASDMTRKTSAATPETRFSGEKSPSIVVGIRVTDLWGISGQISFHVTSPVSWGSARSFWLWVCLSHISLLEDAFSS